MMYYVMFNGFSWFVKEAGYFEQQKKESPPNDKWWSNWKPLEADSIEDARRKAAIVYKHRR